METIQLPKDLNAAYTLQFLVNHDWDDFSPALKDEARITLAPDQPGSFSLDARARTFTIRLDGGRTNNSKWTFSRPATIFNDLRCVPGILYTAPEAPIPSGRNTFWIQQYQGTGGRVGRTVIEFYTDNVITAVFKTNVDSFGASGDGMWS